MGWIHWQSFLGNAPKKLESFEPADDVFIMKVGPNAFGNDISTLLDTLGYEKGNMCL